MKNLHTDVLLSHRLALKLLTKQCSKQNSLQMIVLLNITTNTSITKWPTSKQKCNNKHYKHICIRNTQTTIMSVSNDVYIYKLRIFAFKNIHQTLYPAISKANQSIPVI